MLCLDLHYLITAFSKAEIKSKAHGESYIIEKTMEILSNNSTIKGYTLKGSRGIRFIHQSIYFFTSATRKPLIMEIPSMPSITASTLDNP